LAACIDSPPSFSIFFRDNNINKEIQYHILRRRKLSRSFLYYFIDFEWNKAAEENVLKIEVKIFYVKMEKKCVEIVKEVLLSLVL